jgi:hypothetical protein
MNRTAMRTRPNAYSDTWHAVFGATQPAESTAHEVAFLARVLPLPDSGVEDVFSWQLFTPEELTKLAGSVGLLPFLACTDFDETISPSAEHARMQLVFERD